MEELVHEIKRLVYDALFSRDSDTLKEIHSTLIEDVEVRDFTDWDMLVHREIPNALYDILRRAGLKCKLYRKKDDVPGFEYVANCITQSGEKVAIGFDIEYDPETAKVELVGATAYGHSWWTEDLLVHYRRV